MKIISFKNPLHIKYDPFILTAPLELTQFILIRVVNLTDGGLSGYSCPHSKRRLYMRFSKAVCKKKGLILNSKLFRLYFSSFQIVDLFCNMHIGPSHEF